MNGRKNILVLASVSLLFGGVLTSCGSETTSPSQDSSSVSVAETAKNVVIESQYGYILPSVAQAEVGSNVTYTVVSNDETRYDPVAIEINGTRYDLKDDDTYTASMAEGGNEVFPIFKGIVGSFKVTPDYYSITVEKIDGALYRLGDGQWQESNVFTDSKNDPENRIVPHTEYQVSVKIAGQEDKGLLESDVATKTVTTIPNRETVMDKLLVADFAYKGEIKMELVQNGEILQTVSYQSQSVLTEDRFTVVIDSTDPTTGATTHDSVSFLAGEHGLLSQETVDYTNHVAVLPVDNQTTFASQFMNPFTTITNDEVSLNEDESLLTIDTDTILYPYLFPMLLVGDSTIEVTSVTVPVDDLNPEGLSFEGHYYLSGATVNVSYTGSLVDPDSIQADHVEPYETLPEHAQLKTLFDSLAKSNYTVHVEDSQAGEEDLYVLPKQALFVKADGSKSGIVQTEDGFARYDVKKDEDGTEYMQGWEGYPMADHDIAEFQISFDFAPEVFSYANGKFHLRDDINLYNQANHILPDSINVDSNGYIWLDLGSLDVVIDEDGATFTYSYTDQYNQVAGTVKAVVTNIGTTTIPEMAFRSYNA